MPDTGERSEERRVNARVEARCPWCGPVEFPAEDLSLYVGSEAGALFEFACPRCGRTVVRPLDRKDAGTLMEVGVPPSRDPGPLELLEEHSGPPITWNDIIDFHEAMSRRDVRSVAEQDPAAARAEAERDAA